MKTLKLTLCCILSVAVVLLTSCDRKCGDCGVLKSCVNGQCVCPQGLEGTNCEIYSYQKFVGSYLISESYNPAINGSSSGYYQSNITTGSAIDHITIINFANTGASVDAVINTIYVVIPDQDYGGFHFAGQGTFNTNLNQLKLTSQISYSGGGSVITSTYQHL